MKKSARSRKRKIWLTGAGLILLVAGLGFYFLSPYSIYNREATRLLQQFYPAFMKKDYASIAGLMDDGSPQMIIHDRHWYGDMRKYQILYIRDDGKNRKKALVRVATILEGETKHYFDTLYLVRGKEWKLKSYHTTYRKVLP